MAEIIDAHHHLWRLSRGDYGWLTPAMTALYRDFGLKDLEAVIGTSGVTRTILVQAAATEDETVFLLDLAEDTDTILGVVGWLDFESPDFPQKLERLRRHKKLVGLRPMLQDLKDDAYIIREDVIRNLEYLSSTGLCFDALIRPRHLPFVAKALARCPSLKVVIDHLAKPPVAAGTPDPWQADLARLARLPQVSCKLSGLVTEAGGTGWTAAQLDPWILRALAIFGPARLMWGSDWPVCLLAASYAQVLSHCREALSGHLDEAAMSKVFATNAAQFYSV